MIQRGIFMDFERKFSYFEWKDELSEHFDWYAKRCVGIDLYWDEFIREFEAEWLGINSQYQNDERLRFCVIFPLILLEIKLDLLSPELREEFEIYNDDYQNGKLDSLFKSRECAMIDLDFNFCNSCKDKDYNDRSVSNMKYYKLHTDEWHNGEEKTFKSIPLFEDDNASIAITMLAHQILGTPLPDNYTPSDKYGYAARKSEFAQWYEKEKDSKRGNFNIAEHILDSRYPLPIKENGMCRFLYTMIAFIKQIEDDDITEEMLYTVKWAIQAFESEGYETLFTEKDYALIKEDIKFIKTILDTH